MESFIYPVLLYENAQSLYACLDKQSIPVVTSSRQIKCASSTTALTLPLNLTSFRYRPQNIQHVQTAICMHQSWHLWFQSILRLDNVVSIRDAGTRKGPGGAEFVEGHRQNFNYVKIHILEFGGSVAFLLRQILTNHILSIASAMTLNINTSQISSIDRVTAGFIITN